MTGYKPGLLLELLGITREQLRYWRRELDPVPSRPLFTYQLLLGYAVLRELIIERWLEPRRLKHLNMKQFFAWFEIQHSKEELTDLVITIDKHTGVLRFYSRKEFRPSQLSHELSLEAIYLMQIEEQLIARFQALGR